MPRILVVDDDALARAVVSDAVRSLGYEVVTAAGGAQALAAFAESRFDLVVTDVRMPQVDGFDVARAISESTHPVPVVLVSGVRDAELVAESARRGIEVAAFLGKPPGVEPLGRTLERWCSAPLPTQEQDGDDWSGEEFLGRVAGPIERFPPMRVLYLAYRVQATGQLTFTAGRDEARISVRAGKVTHASGFPGLLGREGGTGDLGADVGAAVASGQPVDLALEAATTGLGAALVAMVGSTGGWVRWEAATASRPGGFPLPSAVPAMLAAGARRVRSEDVLEALWGRREYVGVVHRAPDDSSEARWGLDANAARVLRLIAPSRTFGPLVRKAVGADVARRMEALRAIDTLYLLGFLLLDPAAIQVTRMMTGTPRPEADPAQLEQMRAALRDMEGRRPSELLNLVDRAKLTPDVVAAAWREASRRFHPDQYYSAAPEIRTLAEAAFAELNAAYERLQDPAGLVEEERFLDARRRGVLFISERDKAAARVAFRKGEVLFRAREWKDADGPLSEAERLDPTVWPHAFFAAQAAWLSRRISPEAALLRLGEVKTERADQAAELDVAIGTVLKSLGRSAEAQARFRAALEKFPENRDAQREVRLHAMREPAPATPSAGLFAGLLQRKKPEPAG